MTDFNGKMKTQAWMIAPETLRVMQALCEDGGDARFVGGCVRDALANRRVTDIDIATPLTPDQVIARLERHEIFYAPTGLKHGTVTALVEGHPFEITTLRLDVQTFGRHAEVAFTDDWTADAARRDFTFNAMSATLEGDIFDPFGGVEDLRLGQVRFVGDAEARIHEDVLRILRFFRFYAHFGQGAPDTAALAACTAAAAQIKTLSAERIRQEIFKLLESDRCPMVWQLMLQAGIIPQFLPQATQIKTLERLVQLEHSTNNPPFALRRLSSLLKVQAGDVKNTVQALRLSNDQSAYLLKMKDPAHHISLQAWQRDVKRHVYRLGSDVVRSLLLLAAAETEEAAPFLALYRTATSFRAPRFPLTGEDVMNIGYAPGPDIGRILGLIEEWWLQQDFQPGRTECLHRLESEFRRG